MKQRYLVPVLLVGLTAFQFGANTCWGEQDTLTIDIEVGGENSALVTAVVEGAVAEEAVVEVAAEESPANADEKAKCDSKAGCESKDKACDSSATSVATADEAKPKRKSSSAVGRLLRSMVPGLGGKEDSDAEFKATHSQVALLKVKPSELEEGQSQPGMSRASWSVKSFCLDHEDNLLVAVGDDKAGELQLLDAAGERQQAWQLPIVPEAINVDHDGNFLVAGAGRLMKLDKQGSVLLEAESPLVAYLKNNQEKIREQVIEQMKAQAQSYSQMTVAYERQIERLSAKASRLLDADDRNEYTLLKKRVAKFSDEQMAQLSVEEQNAWALRKVLLRMLEAKVEANMSKADSTAREVYRKQIKQFKELASQQGSAEPTEEKIQASLEAMLAYKSRIASISSNDSEVFIATGAGEGYGYDVWRFDAKLENPEKIVTELRGCCGQMDVQACEAGLFVAENSRHQVRQFDFKGEKVNEWGGREREGIRGFGSCCNPMNVAFGPDGSVYTAESGSGRIKRYSAEGELTSLVGSVELVPGCKKVSIAVSKDHQRVYMLDITRNHIIVMEAKPAEQQVVSNDEVKAAS